MGNPSAAHEPSMEEILASIRQIISEDEQSEEGEAPPEAQSDAEAVGDEEAGEPPAMSASEEEGEPMQAGAGQGSSDAPSATADTPVESPAPPPAAREPQTQPTLRRQPAPGGFSKTASAMAAPAAPEPDPATASEAARQPAPRTAIQAAAQRHLDDRQLLSPEADASVAGAFSALAHTILAQNARTLEDLVTEMLRPMLKEWLDDNLPSLVERLVREEIERVSRARR